MTDLKLLPAISALSFSALGLFLVFLQMDGVISVRVGFTILTVLLMAYLGIQILHVRRVNPDRWLLNPVVLCSVMTFILGFGITNILFFLPAEDLRPLGMVPDVSPAMFKLMWLVLLGAIGMWAGYWSPLAALWSGPLPRQRFSKLLQKSNQLRPWAIPILLVVSISVRLIAIQLGVFGYSSSYERLIEMGAVTQYIALLSALGKLALVATSLEYYSNEQNKKARSLFFLTLAVEVSFGFLSGFKSAVALPFIIVGVCQYLKKGSLPKKWIVLFLIGIFIAYQVIEPFRDAKNSNRSYQGDSVTEIFDVMAGAVNDSSEYGEDEGRSRSVLAIIARSSMAYIGSLGIDFADQVGDLPEGSPQFLQDILLAPFHAWIPRLVWQSKPLGDIGLWYTRVVVGYHDSFSATAMSSFTFLYFSGGAVAVFLGFFFLGAVQRLIWFLAHPTIYSSGAIVFLGILQPISVLGDSLASLIIVLVRELPLLLLMQVLLYRGTVNLIKSPTPVDEERHTALGTTQPRQGNQTCVD